MTTIAKTNTKNITKSMVLKSIKIFNPHILRITTCHYKLDFKIKLELRLQHIKETYFIE